MGLVASDPRSLLALEGRDGGWGYRGGSSWTEPTAYAVLALAACGYAGEATVRGLEWLRRAQRRDGGWPPHPAVDTSTWVTALPLLLSGERSGWGDAGGAADWLLRQSGRESGWLHRLRAWMLGTPSNAAERFPGWPFYPRTAAWVVPTALTILALEKATRPNPSAEVRERLEAGRAFLLARRCRDGGWNHGSSRALGYEAGSYPETTGVALLALRGVPRAQLGRSLGVAEEAYRRCRSAEGLAWLRLALTVHGVSADALPAGVRCRHTVDAALVLLAEAAAQGRNLFIG